MKSLSHLSIRKPTRRELTPPVHAAYEPGRSTKLLFTENLPSTILTSNLEDSHSDVNEQSHRHPDDSNKPVTPNDKLAEWERSHREERIRSKRQQASAI